MFDLSPVLNVIPKPVLLMLAGGMVVGYAEVRFMTVADFTKSYVLDLKAAIRDYRADLKGAETDRERALIQEQIDALLDELCEERPKDPYCEGRTLST